MGGGDKTLNIKNFMKNLKSLSGGDDSIFVIVDDRSDVWMEEVRENDRTIRRTNKNLLIIPAYFYHDSSFQ